MVLGIRETRHEDVSKYWRVYRRPGVLGIFTDRRGNLGPTFSELNHVISRSWILFKWNNTIWYLSRMIIKCHPYEVLAISVLPNLVFPFCLYSTRLISFSRLSLWRRPGSLPPMGMSRATRSGLSTLFLLRSTNSRDIRMFSFSPLPTWPGPSTWLSWTVLI